MDFKFLDYEFDCELNKTLNILNDKGIHYEVSGNALLFSVKTMDYTMEVIGYHKNGEIKDLRIILEKLKSEVRRSIYHEIMMKYEKNILPYHARSLTIGDIRSSYTGLCNMVILLYFSSHTKEEEKEKNTVMRQYDTKGIWSDITEIFLYKEFV